ncbi:MAG: hypothetical protein ACPGO3_13280 [Magnetospiraceae bacterium]
MTYLATMGMGTSLGQIADAPIGVAELFDPFSLMSGLPTGLSTSSTAMSKSDGDQYVNYFGGAFAVGSGADADSEPNVSQPKTETQSDNNIWLPIIMVIGISLVGIAWATKK